MKKRLTLKFCGGEFLGTKTNEEYSLLKLTEKSTTQNIENK